MGRQRKIFKKRGKRKLWRVIPVVVFIVGGGYWLSTLPPDERRDGFVWLTDIYRWGSNGFRGPMPERLESFTPDTSTANAYLFGGLPVDERGRNLRILQRTGYLAAFDEDRGTAAWTAYTVTRNQPYPLTARPDSFSTDFGTAARVDSDDYMNSGFDRGHLAPNFAITVQHGPRAQTETFLMSNIVPQRPDLNQGLWRAFEERVAGDYAYSFETVWVITGPIYDEDRTWLASKVEIPDAFYKVLLGQNGERFAPLAVVLPQQPYPSADLTVYLTSIDEVEAQTGLDFLPLVDDAIEVPLESNRRNALW